MNNLYDLQSSFLWFNREKCQCQKNQKFCKCLEPFKIASLPRIENRANIWDLVHSIFSKYHLYDVRAQVSCYDRKLKEGFFSFTATIVLWPFWQNDNHHLYRISLVCTLTKNVEDTVFLNFPLFFLYMKGPKPFLPQGQGSLKITKVVI